MRLVSDDAIAIITLVQEVAGEPYDGKLAVAEVIRRRMRLGFQSDGTVAGTLLRAYAFSGWNTKPDFLRIRTIQLHDSDAGVQDCARAWREGATSNLVPQAVNYVNLDIAHPDWATPDRFVAKVGHHSFYRR